MNSAQRRKQKRHHPYSITVYAKQNRTYYEHDLKIHRAVKWCKKHIRKGSWKMRSRWEHAEFDFSNEGDATWFALKWI